MLLADAMRRQNNNFDLLRLIAAVMVIVGHSFALAPVEGEIDPLQSWIGITYSGALAVKFFFFLSGLLVTNSLLQKSDIIDFAVMRAVRVVPAIAVSSAVLALVVGPIFTRDYNYFSNSEVYKFIIGNTLIDIRFNLPGVFTDLPHKAVNGSLWTIPYEVGSYIAVAGLFLVGALKNKHVAAAICVFFIIDSLLPQGGFFLYFFNNTEVRYLPFSFALGALCAIYKDRISLTFGMCLGLMLLSYVLWDSIAQHALFYSSVFFTSLFISTWRPIVMITPKWDVSYGIYLYGWPAQQIMASIMPQQPRLLDIIMTTTLAIICACISWVAIERPALNYGRTLLKQRLPERVQMILYGTDSKSR